MRPTDLLALPFASLGQQKLRTMLTTLGVISGSFVLAASLSIGEGVQETIDRESRRNDFSRKVTVLAKWEAGESKPAPEVEVEGPMDPDRRERLRKALAEERRAAGPERVRVTISRDRLEKLAGLPHVERVVPVVQERGLILLGGKAQVAGIYSGPGDDANLRKRIVVGRGFDSPDHRAVLVSELLAYRMGLAGDLDLRQLIGQALRVEFRGPEVQTGFAVSILKAEPGEDREERQALEQLAAQLPGSLDKLALTDREAEVLRQALQAGPPAEPEVGAGDFQVVGVFRQATKEEEKEPGSAAHADSGLILPYRAAADLYFREPGRREQGLGQAVLLVDDERNVRDVAAMVGGLGLEGKAAIDFIDRERLIYDLIFGGMTCVAGVALLVSALGIANTMLMSVLERRREIGIMKAVGADNRHLLCLFMIEGGLIGLVGAAIGLVLAWAASFPADAWVRSMVLRDIKIDLKSTMFVFPPWLVATVLAFTVLVTTLAALYPARHAARIDPVSALRN